MRLVGGKIGPADSGRQRRMEDVEDSLDYAHEIRVLDRGAVEARRGVGIGSSSKVHGKLHSETQDVGQSIFLFQGAYPGWA